MGLVAIWVKSDLRIPSDVAKFLSFYLLFNIGIRGGHGLAEQGISFISLKVIFICISIAFIAPIIFFYLLRTKLDIYNSGAVAATYGSISLVTFATAMSYIDNMDISYGGYMVAGMAFMEVAAIISGLILISWNDSKGSNRSIIDIAKGTLSSGSVFLLLGSFVIGFLTAEHGRVHLETFVYDIFKGMLCLYMIDMGLYTAQRLNQIQDSARFLTLVALVFPITSAFLAMTIGYLAKLELGDAFLLCMLCSSASYIAVPAAMRMSVPKANIGMIIPLTLGVTFPFNIIIGIPLYYAIMERIWS